MIAPAPLGGWSPAEILCAMLQWTVDRDLPLDRGFPRAGHRDFDRDLLLAPARAPFGHAPSRLCVGTPPEGDGFFTRTPLHGELFRCAAEIYLECRRLRASLGYILPRLVRMATTVVPCPGTRSLPDDQVTGLANRLRVLYGPPAGTLPLGGVLRLSGPTALPAGAVVAPPSDSESDAASSNPWDQAVSFSDHSGIGYCPALDRANTSLQDAIRSHDSTRSLRDRVASLEEIVDLIGDWAYAHRHGEPYDDSSEEPS